MHELEGLKRDDTTPIAIQERAFQIVLNGMKLMGDWTAKVKEQVVFKASNPIDDVCYHVIAHTSHE